MEMAAKLMQRIRPKAQNPQKEINEEILQQVQQVREQMLRTEREWVVNVPEKDIELEKTLGGD